MIRRIRRAARRGLRSLRLLPRRAGRIWRQETAFTRLQRGRAIWGAVLVAPWVAGFLLFKLFPVIFSFVLSFTNFRLSARDNVQFIGLRNYLRMLGDANVWISLFANLSIVLLGIPLQLGAALFFSILLTNRRLVGKPFYRVLFFLPSIIPSAAFAQIIFGFLDPSSGLLTYIVTDLFHLPASAVGNLLYDGTFITLMLVLWSCGPGYLILLAAMQSVPHELYDAARVDGAGPVSRLLNVTLPAISPAIFFSLVIGLIAAFGGKSILDSGNPFTGSLSPVDGYIYTLMFTRMELGYAAGVAWGFFLLVMAATLFLFRSSRHWVFYADREEIL